MNIQLELIKMSEAAPTQTKALGQTVGTPSQAEQKEKVKSLVRYSKPTVVSKNASLKAKKGGNSANQETIVTNTQDILNSILPPLEWVKNGQHYGEYVLSTPATRADVVTLQKELDDLLQIRRARETGICPVREELYAQCFDELIRQITIICSHRGLLLVRVRDEMRMTIQAYQTLYESALAFGMRFALKGEQNRAMWNNQILELTEDNELLEQQVMELEASIQAIEEEDEKVKEAEAMAHNAEVEQRQKTIEDYRKRVENKLLDIKG